MEWVIGFLVVIFNAGGVFWLARNHFAHVNQTLKEHGDLLRNIGERVAKIEGQIGKD